MFISENKRKYLAHLTLIVLVGFVIGPGNLLRAGAAEKVTKRNLEKMIASATTAEDHKAIADYYYAEAATARAKADEHKEMALFYKKVGEPTKKVPYAPGTIGHCENLARKYESLSEDLTALAKEHEAMAAKSK